jgi:hypothetical protein
MGMCKGCGIVYSAIEMKDGYCKSCQKDFIKIDAHDDNNDNIKHQNNNKSNDNIKHQNSNKSNDNTKHQNSNKSNDNTTVIITDIKMPFLSMVFFMVKWVIASIPAFIILIVFGAIISLILGSSIGLISRGY